ncbi:MAG: hypothetical protein C0456_10955 [Hyphomonas sp.]|nr:hypothetical protein [Hyphomonas sp.]
MERSIAPLPEGVGRFIFLGVFAGGLGEFLLDRLRLSESGPTLSLPMVMGRGPVALWGEVAFRRSATCPLPTDVGRVGVGALSA